MRDALHLGVQLDGGRGGVAAQVVARHVHEHALLLPGDDLLHDERGAHAHGAPERLEGQLPSGVGARHVGERAPVLVRVLQGDAAQGLGVVEHAVLRVLRDRPQVRDQVANRHPVEGADALRRLVLDRHADAPAAAHEGVGDGLHFGGGAVRVQVRLLEQAPAGEVREHAVGRHRLQESAHRATGLAIEHALVGKRRFRHQRIGRGEPDVEAGEPQLEHGHRVGERSQRHRRGEVREVIDAQVVVQEPRRILGHGVAAALHEPALLLAPGTHARDRVVNLLPALGDALRHGEVHRELVRLQAIAQHRDARHVAVHLVELQEGLNERVCRERGQVPLGHRVAQRRVVALLLEGRGASQRPAAEGTSKELLRLRLVGVIVRQVVVDEGVQVPRPHGLHLLGLVAEHLLERVHDRLHLRQALPLANLGLVVRLELLLVGELVHLARVLLQVRERDFLLPRQVREERHDAIRRHLAHVGQRARVQHLADVHRELVGEREHRGFAGDVIRLAGDAGAAQEGARVLGLVHLHLVSRAGEHRTGKERHPAEHGVAHLGGDANDVRW